MVSAIAPSRVEPTQLGQFLLTLLLNLVRGEDLTVIYSRSLEAFNTAFIHTVRQLRVVVEDSKLDFINILKIALEQHN